jgi:cobalt transporter subunit CbtA
MIFSRIIFSAVLIGLVTGSLMTTMQIFTVNPIIFAAETYEIVEHQSRLPEQDGNDDHGKSWAPEDGAERTAYTLLANSSVGIGFSAVLLALMNQFRPSKSRKFGWAQGALWGLAGFTAIYLAPGIGIPPEIPGFETAPIQNRQLWWVFTVISVSTGLGILAFTVIRVKAIGLIFLAMPYIIGAPGAGGAEFLHPDPAATLALTQLQEQFIITSGITNLIFWLISGIICCCVFNRWLRQIAPSTKHASS